MQRRMNIQSTSLIILLSVLTILLQFTIYYFFEAAFIIWGVSCLITIICCHLLLEMTNTYEVCFQYATLTIFVSLVINVICYYGKVQSFLPYSGTMLGIFIINWLIPVLHCSLRSVVDYGTKIDDFYDFYRNISILFFTFYIVIVLIATFSKNTFPWAYPINYDTFNLLPFGIISTLIEDYLYGNVTLSEIITYLFSHILAFIPYGYYITLALRRQTRLPRFFALLLFPFVIEVLQFYFNPAYCDIDDLIYALIGGLVGSFIFFLTNTISLAISGREFLMKDNDYRFANGKLHF